MSRRPSTSGTVIESFHVGGATVREVRAMHPLATVEPVEAA
jgi:hypothetical protein